MVCHAGLTQRDSFQRFTYIHASCSRAQWPAASRAYPDLGTFAALLACERLRGIDLQGEFSHAADELDSTLKV
jgi:hypothetical protein